MKRSLNSNVPSISVPQPSAPQATRWEGVLPPGGGWRDKDLESCLSLDAQGDESIARAFWRERHDPKSKQLSVSGTETNLAS